MKKQLIKDLNIWPDRILIKESLDYMPHLGVVNVAQVGNSYGKAFTYGEYTLSTARQGAYRAYLGAHFGDRGLWITHKNLFELIDKDFVEIL